MNIHVLNLYWTLSLSLTEFHTPKQTQMESYILCMHAKYMYACMQHTHTHMEFHTRTHAHR